MTPAVRAADTSAADTAAGSGAVDVLAVPVWQGEVVSATSGASPLDARELSARRFEGELGQTARLGGSPSVVAVGMGKREGADLETLRRAAAAVVRAAWRDRMVVAPLLDHRPEGVDADAAARAVAEGAALASYRYTAFKREPSPCRIESFVVTGAGVGADPGVAGAVAQGEAVAQAVALARDLVNTPPGRLTPAVFAERAVDVAGGVGVEVEVLDEVAAAELRLGGLLGVGQGSENPPRLVKLTWTPESSRARVALVGKGITFDSGGLSLKTGEGMMGMKYDMSGAAAVLATLSVLPVLRPDVTVVGYLCLAENMPSGRAIRPGDLLEIRDGTTVEVLNTDAEGRLVLADGLSLAAEAGPDAIVDLATLTGACKVALGSAVAGLMGNDEALIDRVEAAARRAGEQVWHLPLPGRYAKLLDSDVADVKNVTSTRDAGALTAGLFLRRFVGDVPWAHLDIAGPAWADEDDGYVAKGGTGFGVRTLTELLASF